MLIRNNPSRLRVHNSTKKNVVVACGRRFGSTDLCVELALAEADKGGYVVYIAPEPQLRLTSSSPLHITQKIIEDCNPEAHTEFYQHEKEVIIGSGKVQFMSLGEHKKYATCNPPSMIIVDQPSLMGDLDAEFIELNKSARMIFAGSKYHKGCNMSSLESFCNDPRANNKDWELFSFSSTDGGVVFHEDFIGDVQNSSRNARQLLNLPPTNPFD